MTGPSGVDVMPSAAGALALSPGQTRWSDEQLAVLRHMGTEKATTADLQVFLHRCQTLALDPFAGQIHLVEYGGKPVIQVGVHGLESVADRVAAERGVTIAWEPTVWCGDDGIWSDVWLSPDPPTAARAVLLRDSRPFPATVLFREFVGMRRTKAGGWEINSMWSGKPAWMLGKCARAAALRMAFPTQLANVYIPDELGERPDTVPGQVVQEEPRAAPYTDEDLAELIASASTVDELRGLWRGLSVTQRAHMDAAFQAARAALETI